MKISGFTFIKNGITLGYPVIESIQSIAPLCDEVVINVGFGNPELTQDDGTYQLLRDTFTQSKFVFLKNFWDPKIVHHGEILSQQTNLALAKTTGEIGQYIQADELIHENDLSLIENDFKKLYDHKIALGIIFHYIHFYGNTQIIKHTRNMYRREVRTIKLNQNIKSWKDAQGFRSAQNKKIHAFLGHGHIYHYGWARLEKIMDLKIQEMSKLYHGNNSEKDRQFQYRREWGMKPFAGTHPAHLTHWIEKHNNPLDDIFNSKLHFPIDNIGLMICDFVEKWTNYRLGEYKNYKLVD